MKSQLIATLTAAGLLALSAGALGQSTAQTSFTYQGQIAVNGQPFSGDMDVELRIFDAATGGQQLGVSDGGPATAERGVFTVECDPQADAFLGNGNGWLEVRVRAPSQGGQWQTLSPRQKLTGTPYSLSTRGLTVNKTGDVGVGGSMASNFSSLSRFLSIIGLGSGTGTAGIVYHNPVANASWSGGVEQDGSFRFRKDGSGSNHVVVPVLRITGGSDVAEPFDIDGTPAAGMVVAIDPDKVGALRIADGPYDRTVAGIVSGAGGVNPGMVLTQRGTAADGSQPVAMTGRVWCWCDADAGGPIHAGDLLTTSATPGHAMRVSDHAAASGATIGKAMSPLPGGKGLVLVLVNLQ